MSAKIRQGIELTRLPDESGPMPPRGRMSRRARREHGRPPLPPALAQFERWRRAVALGHEDTARAALERLERFGDRDGNGE